MGITLYDFISCVSIKEWSGCVIWWVHVYILKQFPK
jgi:hypothetical protein